MPTAVDTRADLLETIIAATRRIVEVRRGAIPIADLERRASISRRPGGDRFREALSQAGRINLIAECKRRSPSRGVICNDYDPVAIARAYAAGGASAVSILTEPTFFDGSLEHLADVRTAVDLPLLRKDFIVDPYQLAEAAAAGADAVLLIVAALDDVQLRELMRGAADLGLACLTEVHDDGELTRAIDAGATIVGVNNRSLRTLEVRVDVSRELILRIPRGVVAVAESGLTSGTELHELRAAGYSAFLVGESLMTSPDPAAAVREMLKVES